MLFWLGMLLTALMGLSLGLLGGGGSILAVPILVYVFRVDAHAAVALSLVLVGSTALAAALLHQREARVDWRAGFLFAACGAPVSLLGAAAAKRLSGELLLSLFAALMLIVGAAMLRKRAERESGEAPHHFVALVLCGALVGFLTGFLGVGGGFLIVPALVLFLGKPMKHAVGTSLIIIALNCAIALWGHRAALRMNWEIVLPATLAALAGTWGGVELSRHTSAAGMRRAFAWLVMALGAVMLWKNLSAL
ncbi:MAG TPA: sulfite exporter TauE/SafE family protein [Candidatus Nitrosotenuis sp.]|nr:sulfite exporter TauE/SafE family protein [Candidatus Nitrosotenuis sp.]